MARKIALTFTKCGTTAVAEMLDRHAPRTCAAMWSALSKPAVNLGIHAMYVGREVAFDLPGENKAFDGLSLPPENQVIFPIAGDICFKYYRPFEVNMPGMGNPQEDDVFDVIIIYGRNARLFSSQGWIPCNLFAQIKENLEGFAKVCASIRYEGIKELRLSRVA